MNIGASYYPELSDRATWESDLNVARDLGLRLLRCGEFSWSRWMPRSGAWEADWASSFLDLAASKGFQVVWCTPSATPPPSLFERWPDLRATTCDGLAVPVGVRRNACPSHDGYRELCGDVAGRIAEAIGSHPALLGWQIDNEIAGDGFTCWCPRCGEAFAAWLEARYGTLDALNAAWRTGVWSQHYAAWREVPIPHRAFPSHAPALKLAWRRFRSDRWLAFHRTQRDALRRGGASAKPVTTNFYDLSWDVPFDQWAWRPHLDVLGQSLYAEDATAARFELALLRGLDGKAVWVLEQKAGQQNAQNLYPEPLDRLGVHLQLCAEGGAATAIYWHLRQHLSGCEMEHGAVLRHDGRPTRIARAIAEAIPGAVAAPLRLPPVEGGPVLVFDFEQHWAQETRPQPGTRWDYRERLEQDWYGAALDLREGGVRVGPLAAALAAVRTEGGEVWLPHFQMAGEGELAALRAFLWQGGRLVVTADFGRLDRENNVLPAAPLAAVAALVPEAAVPGGEMLQLRPE
ncbi:MAG TPA: beta-galactosidase, partial [Candidatus Methylacidiphilales bacterium]